MANPDLERMCAYVKNIWYADHSTTRERIEGVAGLARLVGTAAGVRGPVLYNPFGGADVITQFSLSPDITTVISHGRERFGSVEQTFKSMFTTYAAASFDFGSDLSEVEYMYGGIASLILKRLLDLGATINAIEPQQMTPQGTLIPYDQPSPHGTIRFTHDRKEKTLTYIGANVKNLPLHAEQFFRDLHFDTLLVKAAMQWWEHFTPEEIYSLGLANARMNDSRVVTDSYYESHGIIGSYTIWCRKPLAITAPGFGYAGRAFYGDGKDLLTQEEAERMNPQTRMRR